MIPFLDGSSERLCRSGRAEAFTTMGIPRVYGCPSFVEKQVATPAADSIVIHDMLHTLGLGENPPTSREITAVAVLPVAVRGACGRATYAISICGYD